MGRMKRYPLIAAILAIVTCGLASAPAGAASVHSHVSQVAAGPDTFRGAQCQIVFNVFRQSGEICITVYTEPWEHSARAEVTFVTHSGALRELSLKSMRFRVNGIYEDILHFTGKFISRKSGIIPDNWYDGGGMRRVQASVYNACMQWANGARACTGPRWFSSLIVRL